MYLIVIGGGKVGYYLTKALLEEDHEVLLVEKDRARYLTLFEELGDVVFNGDGDEMRTLEEIGARRAEVIMAVTGDDEDNLVACQLAKRHFGCPRVIARVNNPKNEEVFKKLGIDATVSSTRILFGLLEQEMEVPEVVPLLALQKGKFEIVGISIPPRAPVIGKSVKELNLPQNCILIAITRNDETIIPKGDTILDAGDEVMSMMPTGKQQELHDVLLGKYH